MSWSDPRWQQLYPVFSPDLDGAAVQQQQPDPATHYLDVLQQAASAGATVNLSDMAGYQTNLSSPAHEAA